MPRFLWQGMGIAALGLCLLAASPEARAESLGERVYKERCGQCHPHPDPKKLTPEQWAKQLEIVAPLAELNAKEKAAVLEFLQSHTRQKVQAVSMAEEKRLFEEKCSLCHSLERVFLVPLTDESRRHIVFRMREHDPNWISEEEARLILDYLSRVPPQARALRKKEPAGSPQALFRQRCSACHSLERVYLQLDEHRALSWAHVVKRMQEKAPQWLTDQEAEQILQYLQTLKPVKKQ